MLGAVSVALALVAAAPLLVGATFGARSSRGDVLWAMLSAAPEVVVVALGVWVVFAARRPTPSSREVGARALAGGLLLAVPCLVGGAWAMLLTAGNVTQASIPPDIARDFLAPDGTYRLTVVTQKNERLTPRGHENSCPGGPAGRGGPIHRRSPGCPRRRGIGMPSPTRPRRSRPRCASAR